MSPSNSNHPTPSPSCSDLHNEPTTVVRPISKGLGNTSLDNLQALVHQLEAQNEELQSQLADLSETCDCYSGLYDRAPIGYMSLEADGEILSANLFAASLLGLPRTALAGKNLSRFVSRSDLETLSRHLRELRSAESSRNCELTMDRADGSRFTARLESKPRLKQDGRPDPFYCLISDVTELIRAETMALQAERLRQMVENLPAGAVFVEYDHLQMNRAAEMITGRGRHELANRERWFKTLYRDDADEEQTIYEKNRRAGFPVKFTTTIIRADDELRVIEFAAHCFDGHEVWLLNDVTERQQAEEAQRDSEARTRAILASLPAHIAVIDQTGTIIAVNPAWEAFAKRNDGIPSGCNTGTNYLDTCRNVAGRDSVEASRVLAGLEAILDGTGGAFSLEYPCHSATELRWFLLHATPLMGPAPGAVISHTDISTRVRAELDLRREHELKEQIISTAKMIILLIDLQGRVIRINGYFEKMSGWRSEALDGLDWVNTFIPKRERGRVGNLLDRAAKETPTQGHISPVLMKDGSERLIEWHDAPLKDDRGQVIGLLCTGADVTARRLLEQEVINSAEQERHRTASELHDGLGSLLTGIRLRTEVLANDCAARNPNHATEASEISELIRDAIRQTSSIARGMHPVGDDPEDLMSALAGLASRMDAASPASCQFNCDDPVLVDNPNVANHLFRIAQEALHNAIKYSGAKHLTVSLQHGADQTVLKVEDDGTGFDPEHPRSKGLGLHVMKYRANAINARLLIERNRAGGTKVTCSTPDRPLA